MTLIETQAELDHIARTRALIPALKERAAEAAALRRVPQENIDLLREAGSLKTVQSRRNGGFGFGMATHLEVDEEPERRHAGHLRCKPDDHDHAGYLHVQQEPAGSWSGADHDHWIQWGCDVSVSGDGQSGQFLWSFQQSAHGAG